MLNISIYFYYLGKVFSDANWQYNVNQKSIMVIIKKQFIIIIFLKSENGGFF